MKFKTHGMILSLFFALGLVFSFVIEASASHGGGSDITADQVDPGDRQEMTDFVNHIVDYYNGIRDQLDPVADRAELIRQLTIFARDIRREGGDYRHGEVYAMGINDNNVITNHARYPELIGYKVNPDAGTPLANTFKALLGNSAIGATNCEDYGQNRVACAAKLKSDLTVDVTTIAGFHHEADLDNLDDAFVEPDCTGLALDTTAEEVYDDPSDDNLQAYVRDVIATVQEEVGKITVDVIDKTPGLDLNNPISLAKLADRSIAGEFANRVTTRIQERLFCFGSGDFKHENIYVFVMGADLANSTVLVNGNNFDLNGANLELEDDLLSGEKNIARLFNNKLGDPVDGASTYVNYHWDDPTDPDDNVPNFFEDRKVPGTSCKKSYIEVADLNGGIPAAVAEATGLSVDLIAMSLSAVIGEQLYIFGSGTYPGDDVCASDDDGCAIAGAGHTSQSAFLNLFLVASVLFSVVFLRRRV